MTPNPVNGPSRILRGDGGFIIIEVLVSALILVTVSLAVFLTLDNADKAAGNQQRRALAANFAQSELERLRSLPVEDIAASRGTRTVKDGPSAVASDRDNIKVEFYETITAKWVTDGKDEPECSSRGGGLDYLRLTVEVGWKGQGNAKNVKTTSYYTPPAGAGGGDTGSMSVYLTDRNGDGLEGVDVTADGGSDFTETTNKKGCVVFGFIPAGNYRVKFSRAGYVDGDSNPTVDFGATVTGGDTLKLQFDYDRGGFTSATFNTNVPRRGLRGFTQPQASNPNQVQFFNAAQPTPPKAFAMSGSTSTWDGTNVPLFPFTSKYAVYAGNCQANIPTALNAKFVNISPGAFQGTGAVSLPALDVRVMSGSSFGTPGSPVANALVRYYPGCGEPWIGKTENDTNPVTGGYMADPGFPYTASGGVLCVASPGGGGRHLAQVQQNVNFATGTSVTMYLNGPGSKTVGYTSDSYDCTA